MQQSAADTPGLSYVWLVAHHTLLDRPSQHAGCMGFAAGSRPTEPCFFPLTYPPFRNCQVLQGAVAGGANDFQETKNILTRSRSLCQDAYQRRGTGARQSPSYEPSLLAAV